GLLQRLLEREGTAERKRDEIVPPQLRDVGDLVGQLPIAENVVARYVGAEVEILRQRRQMRVADVGACKQRAGFWIALAIEQEILGPVLGQYAEIGLNAARCQSGCIARIARSDGMSYRAWIVPIAEVFDARGLCIERHGYLLSCAALGFANSLSPI